MKVVRSSVIKRVVQHKIKKLAGGRKCDVTFKSLLEKHVTL